MLGFTKTFSPTYARSPNVQNHRPARIFAQVRWIAMLALGGKGSMVGNFTLRRTRTERERQEKLLWHAGENQPWSVGEAKAPVEGWLAEQYAAGGTALAQQRQTTLNKSPANASFLNRRKNRNRPKTKPASRAVRDSDRRKGDMADHLTGLLGHQRNGKCVGLTQSANNEVLGMTAIGMRGKRLASDFTNGVFVAFAFGTDYK